MTSEVHQDSLPSGADALAKAAAHAATASALLRGDPGRVRDDAGLAASHAATAQAWAAVADQLFYLDQQMIRPPDVGTDPMSLAGRLEASNGGR